MLIGACQTPEIVGDVDAALRVAYDFTAQADTSWAATRKTFLTAGEPVFNGWPEDRSMR